MKTSLFVGGAAALLLLTSSALADKQHFVGNVSSAAEVPLPTPASSACAVGGACSVSFTYDTVSKRICGHALFDKALDITLSHIHAGAATAAGDVIVDLAPPTGSQTQFAFDVTATNAAADGDIKAAFAETDDTVSSIYFNVHTTDFPNGAVRGNFHPDPANATLDECLELDADAGTPDSGVTTTPTDGGGTTVGDSGTDTTPSSTDSSSSCSTAPGTSPGSIMLMLGAAIAVGSIVRSRKKR